jgi:hypothetical protein
MPKRQQSASPPRGKRPRPNTQPAAVAEPTSFAFRTLAGAQTIEVRPSETREAALARHFGVDARRIVLQVLGDEWCVSVLDPFDIYHDSRSPDYRCSPSFMELYRQNLDKVMWYTLSSNPGAFELLAEHLVKVNWQGLSKNPHPGAVALLAANLHKVDWEYLSMNAGAMDILAAQPEKIDWSALSLNSHSLAIEMLSANTDKIDWVELSANTNPAAIEVLAAHPDKIDWSMLSRNSSAIELLTANQVGATISESQRHGAADCKPGQDQLVSFVIEPECDGAADCKSQQDRLVYLFCKS